MRRTASEILNELEVRVASLEKKAIFGIFKSQEKASVTSEEKLLERYVKAIKGVSKVSIDLSNKKRITMSIRFQEVDFHFVGRCVQDLEGIYEGHSKSANPSLILMQRARSSGRSRSEDRGRSRGSVGNIYNFQCGFTRISIHTESGKIFLKESEKIYETLRGLLPKKVKEAGYLEKRSGGGIGFFSLLILMQEHLDKTPSIYVGSRELETAFQDFLSSFGLHKQTKFSELEVDREPDGLELSFMAEGRFFYVELVSTPNGGAYFKKL